MIFFAIFSLFLVTHVNGDATCDISNNENRFDCYPDSIGVTRDLCVERGCCWQDKDRLAGQAHCFYPTNYPSYDAISWQATTYGYEAHLVKRGSSRWPNDVRNLTLNIWFESKTRIHFKIVDSDKVRYEVPIQMPAIPSTKSAETDYNVEYVASPFGLKITRKSTGAVLFNSINSKAPLIYADQFIQITTGLSSPYVYGIGEHLGPMLISATKYNRFFLWAKDQYPKVDDNLYGSHPFYINMEDGGNAHGVFLLNSNAMDVVVQSDPAITFRTIGGVLDFYIFTGPSAEEVVTQYVQSIGLPAFPPYWSLGFHLCRYNYGNITKMRHIIQRNREIGFPYEVQWADIDYMDEKKIWTYDLATFNGLPDLVDDLHENDQKFIVIVDPGVAIAPGDYPAYDKGLEMNVFIKDHAGEVLEGKVWPGLTVFPDFTHPNATEWWYKDTEEFYKTLPYDGLWIDMNEPASFVDGSTRGCSGNQLDNPPYVPGIYPGGKLELKTVCPSAQQYLSSHYNLHSMYGLHEAIATDSAVRRVLKKRTLVVSRSTFPSSGKYSQHWSGDIQSSWEDLYFSIPSIISFQFFGIPFIGADICGFRDHTTEELCVRWMQLGAFYPFMRNHNDDTSIDQDPAAFSLSAQTAMKEATKLRYTLLPYFYTQFYHSHLTGAPVVRPLFFLYPTDVETYHIDKQFVWGDSILVTPVLTKNAKNVWGYFGRGLWYDISTGSVIRGSGKYHDLPAPMDKINVHVKGGVIIPQQDARVTITQARKTGFKLLVALDDQKNAKGELFWDDGESLDSVEKNLYSLIKFNVKDNVLTNEAVAKGYTQGGFKLKEVTIFGVELKPLQVKVDGVSASYEYTEETEVLKILYLNLNILNEFKITWE